MSDLKAAPPVPLDEVEWRVDSDPYSRGGGHVARFIPYVNAAIAARLLDEWVGPDGWSDRYEPGELAGKTVLWCHLSIRSGDQWVTKSDVGKPSNFESEKGMVSDAFKRAACLKWGVARNVYELPTLYAPCDAKTKRDGSPLAVANDRTLPALVEQLKRRGFDAAGGRVLDDGDASGGDERSGAGEAQVADSEPGSPQSAVDQLRLEIVGLVPEAQRGEWGEAVALYLTDNFGGRNKVAELSDDEVRALLAELKGGQRKREQWTKAVWKVWRESKPDPIPEELGGEPDDDPDPAELWATLSKLWEDSHVQAPRVLTHAREACDEHGLDPYESVEQLIERAEANDPRVVASLIEYLEGLAANREAERVPGGAS